MTINVVPSHAWAAREPSTPELRHLLDLLRRLDMRSSDIRLERVFPILLRRLTAAEWREGLDAAMAAYREAQEPDAIRVQNENDPPVAEGDDREPKWIRPREAFSLWAYGGVIHHEYPKEQRWNALGRLQQAPIRMMAHEYAMMLVDQADFLTRLLRSGALDEHYGS
jgi:hypothetical protein